MDKKKGSNNGRKMTKHHILPRSRGGNGENESQSNIVKIPQRLHEAWHTAFGNMTTEEVIKFIRIVFHGEGRRRKKMAWKAEDLYGLQLRLQKETTIRNKREGKR